MTLDDITTALNRYVNKVNPKAVLVVQKELTPCRLKLFKDIRYTLWYVDKLRKTKFNIMTIQRTERIDSAESKDKVLKGMDIEFMTLLFQYLRGEEFNLILGGSYESNESIPDTTV